MNNRSRNGVRNVIAGMGNRIVQIVLPFLSRTILIYTLGSEYLGLSSLFTSILMVLNLSELGIGSALVYSMYRPIAENDLPKLRALLALYKKIFRIIGIVILTIGVFFTPCLKIIIKGDIPTDVNLYVLYYIYLINTAISYFAFAHKKALLTAYQRSDVLSNINSVTSIFLYITQIIILLTSKNYYFYVLVYPVFTVIDNIVAGYMASNKYPNLFCDGSISYEEKLSIKQHVKGIALQQFCSTSRNSLDNIAISMYLGLATIAMYSNYFYIMSSIHIFLYQIPNAVRASVGNTVASETVDKNFDIFNSMYLIYIWVSGWCTSCLLCLYQPFMKLWMGDEMMFPLSTIILFCLYFMLLNMADIIALYKDGAGLWWYGRYRVTIEALANLGLNFLLGYFCGVNGILIATIITLILFGHGYGGWIVFHYYFKGKSFIKFITLQIGYLLIISFAATISYVVSTYIHITPVADIFLIGLMCIILPNLIIYLLLKHHPHYSKSIIFMKTVLKNAYPFKC